MLRVTGKVVRIDKRNGSTANAATGELRDWEIQIARILVADQAIVEVTSFDPLPMRVGETVDIAVEATARGSRLNIAYDCPWAAVSAAPAAVKAV